MSTMQAEIYDAFIAAGAPEPKARAAAEVIAQKPQSDEMATKEYIDKKVAELETRLTWRMISLTATSTTILLLAISALAIFN